MQSKPRYVFGRTRFSRAICKSIKIDYIVDDFVPEGTIFEGAKTIKIENVPKDAIVVNSIMDGACTEVHNKMLDSGINSVISCTDLFYQLPDQFEKPSVILDTREQFLNNQNKWQNTFNNLSDETSKKVLQDVLCYRLTGQYDFLAQYKLRLSEQYFEGFLNLKKNEVFIDCGGFNGDTSEEFIRRCPEFKKIYFFEPDEENYKNAQKRLNNNKKIQFIKKGVSDKNEILKLSLSGSTSCITEGEGLQIEVTTIDEAIGEKITFIKMDLEGWELKALEGAKKHIRNDSPKLAIAVYHKAEDFYKILEYIKSINPSYNVYLRHYTQGWSETIMFFIPPGETNKNQF